MMLLSRKIRVLMICLIFLPSADTYAQTGDKVAERFINNVVQITVKLSNGDETNGFGFVVGERDNHLYVVTANHVLYSSDNPDVKTTEVRVRFKQDEVGKPLTGEPLDVSSTKIDTALLRVRKPEWYQWERVVLCPGYREGKCYQKGEEAWFVGINKKWDIPPDAVAGCFAYNESDLNVDGHIIFYADSVEQGTSGAPLFTKNGIIGMIIHDEGKKARAVHIERIQRLVVSSGILWELDEKYKNIPENERIALLDFYASTNGDKWKKKEYWLNDAGTEYTWRGVICDNEYAHVAVINLDYNNLIGKIPDSIQQLSKLEILSLKGNRIKEIPKSIMKLTHLTNNQSDFRYNSFCPEDEELIAFLNQKQIGNDFLTTQDCYALKIKEVKPNIGELGRDLAVILRGSGFDRNTKFFMFPDDKIDDKIEIKNFTMHNKTEFSLVLPASKTPGRYTLSVSNGTEQYQLKGAVEFALLDPIKKIKKKKAIIVMGNNGDKNILRNITKQCTMKAYQSLISQGYEKDNILFLCEKDADMDRDILIKGNATKENLSYAIKKWTRETETFNLLIYMIGNGGDKVFRLDDNNGSPEVLEASLLDSWLDELQEAINIKLTIIYDACMSGSFLPLLSPPTGKDRIIITSTSANKPAWFLKDGENSFSYFFWDAVLNEGGLYKSFTTAKKKMMLYQTALIDLNGDGKDDEIKEEFLKDDIIIGRGRVSAYCYPQIGKVCEEQKIDCNTSSAKIWVSEISSCNRINVVYAIIINPHISEKEASETPILFMPAIKLYPTMGDNSVYESVYTDFTESGEYKIYIYAIDNFGSQSMPKMTSVIKACDSQIIDKAKSDHK